MRAGKSCRAACVSHAVGDWGSFLMRTMRLMLYLFVPPTDATNVCWTLDEDY